jgi:hypothetical protein
MTKAIYYPIIKARAREIGWIVDGEKVYLAVPLLRADPDYGFFFPHAMVEIVKARIALSERERREHKPDKVRSFSATLYTKALDKRVKTLVDDLITLRFAHPALTQLELVLGE